MNNVERLAEMVGGKGELASVAGVSKSLISRFAARGEMPARYRVQVLAGIRSAMEKKGYPQERIDATLREAESLIPVLTVCPHCGSSLAGRVV